MKNNLIVAGVPRAGKSTLSHRIAAKYGYQHISMDSIIAGFEKCFPETGVNTYCGLSSLDTLRLISGKMAPFVRAMLDSAEYDEFEPGMVLDMYQLLPEDYERYIRGANHLAFGTGMLDLKKYLDLADKLQCTVLAEVKESESLIVTRKYLQDIGKW